MRTSAALLACALLGCMRTQSASLGSADPGTEPALLDTGVDAATDAALGSQARPSDEDRDEHEDEHELPDADDRPADAEGNASEQHSERLDGGRISSSATGTDAAIDARSLLADGEVLDAGVSDAEQPINPLCIIEPWHCL